VAIQASFYGKRHIIYFNRRFPGKRNFPPNSFGIKKKQANGQGLALICQYPPIIKFICSDGGDTKGVSSWV
jgi:hypothetical protein